MTATGTGFAVLSWQPLAQVCDEELGDVWQKCQLPVEKRSKRKTIKKMKMQVNAGPI